MFKLREKLWHELTMDNDVRRHQCSVTAKILAVPFRKEEGNMKVLSADETINQENWQKDRKALTNKDLGVSFSGSRTFEICLFKKNPADAIKKFMANEGRKDWFGKRNP